jgi:hypothetical protein
MLASLALYTPAARAEVLALMHESDTRARTTP